MGEGGNHDGTRRDFPRCRERKAVGKGPCLREITSNNVEIDGIEGILSCGERERKIEKEGDKEGDKEIYKEVYKEVERKREREKGGERTRGG